MSTIVVQREQRIAQIIRDRAEASNAPMTHPLNRQYLLILADAFESGKSVKQDLLIGFADCLYHESQGHQMEIGMGMPVLSSRQKHFDENTYLLGQFKAYGVNVPN